MPAAKTCLVNFLLPMSLSFENRPVDHAQRPVNAPVAAAAGTWHMHQRVE